MSPSPVHDILPRYRFELRIIAAKEALANETKDQEDIKSREVDETLDSSSRDSEEKKSQNDKVKKSENDEENLEENNTEEKKSEDVKEEKDVEQNKKTLDVAPSGEELRQRKISGISMMSQGSFGIGLKP